MGFTKRFLRSAYMNRVITPEALRWGNLLDSLDGIRRWAFSYSTSHGMLVQLFKNCASGDVIVLVTQRFPRGGGLQSRFDCKSLLHAWRLFSLCADGDLGSAIDLHKQLDVPLAAAG